MQARLKDKPHVECETSNFNIHSLSEVLVYFPFGDADSMFIHELEIRLPNGEWKCMRQAFLDKDIIPDNYHTRFGYPKSVSDKDRGYSE